MIQPRKHAMSAAHLVLLSAAAVLSAGANAGENLMEAVGAEKCGGRVASISIRFLAPDSEQLVATATGRMKGLRTSPRSGAGLSIDGRACRDGECNFSAKKGQSYTFAATSELPIHDDLCISVTRR
jgi:hypothetical protein